MKKLNFLNRDFYIFNNSNIDEVRHPEINDVWNYNRNINFNDMETMKEFCDRIYEFLDEITKKYRDKNILIVTHGGTSMLIKCYFMKYPLEKLVDRDAAKGLENGEIMSFNI